MPTLHGTAPELPAADDSCASSVATHLASLPLPCSLFLQGLERYGVGKWREMINSFPELSRYKDTDVRVHAGRLLGAQSLARHVGWKGERGSKLGPRAAAPDSCLARTAAPAGRAGPAAGRFS